jgi:hypothetical protein
MTEERGLSPNSAPSLAPRQFLDCS